MMVGIAKNAMMGAFDMQNKSSFLETKGFGSAQGGETCIFIMTEGGQVGPGDPPRGKGHDIAAHETDEIVNIKGGR